MIESLPPAHNVGAVAPERRRSGQSAEAFTLAGATTALVNGAANALNVHGATGEARVPETAGASGRTGGDKPASSAAPAEARAIARGAELPSTRTPVSDAVEARAAEPRAPVNMTSAPAAASPAPAIAAAPAPLPAAPRALGANAADIAQKAAPDAIRTRPTIAAAPKAAPPPAPEFARLLAQRLADGETRFSFRLDPPELGRVDGQFSMKDDGRSVLTLRFDNQAALDFYHKDRGALIDMLSAVGVDVSDGLEFSLQDNAANGETNTPSIAPTFVAAAPAAIPEHAAAIMQARGLVDIRV